MNKFIIILFTLFANAVFCQTTYFTVKTTSTNTTKFAKGAKLVKLNLEKACLKNPFISIVDRDLIGVAERERKIQRSESFMDGTYVEQDKAIGASIIIFSSYNADDRDLVLELVDVETNELIYKELYDMKPFVYESHGVKREDYFGRYIEEVMTRILEKLNLSKKLNIEIAKISEADKNKAKTVLIYCPDACHLTDGEELEVYQENELKDLGIIEKIIVGRIEIVNVENEKVSLAKVKQGHKEILSIFNSKTKLKCQNASN